MRKKWIRSTLSYIILFILLIGLFNFSMDPLQYYRDTKRINFYWDQQRWQVVGLAKNYEYNTIILGTSMTENFIPSEVNQIFPNTETLKLSLSGSSAHEQNKIAEIAFHNNEIKNVIWGIDYFSLGNDPNYVKEEFPKFLYDNNNFNEIGYLLNISITKYSLYSIFHKLSPMLAELFATLVVLKEKPVENLDYLYYWAHGMDFSNEIVMEDYKTTVQKDLGRNEEFSDTFSLDRLKENIDTNIVPIIMENQDTNFYLFYPPYSILMNKRIFDKNPTNIDNIIKSREYLFNELKDYDNVKIYDFSHDEDIVFNLNNYKDISHYSPEINKKILQDISKGNFLVTETNINLNLDKFNDQVSKFNLVQLK
ncbi:hypothetical protein [Bacillus pinisoli]|uniref:hypothetical protein n=1 Tax=Bacillus pinisoli TaxID=2901866 RepID=UPI001FF6670F|nr:hypothetical protein [Bacillus pinisoli]